MRGSVKKYNTIKIIVLLHVLLFIYSLFGVFSKLAAMQEFFSVKFIVFYGIVIINLAVYAICWQQIIKRIPLVTAYANKAITVLWGVFWGYVFFDEKITINKILGAVIIIIGIICVVSGEEKEE